MNKISLAVAISAIVGLSSCGDDEKIENSTGASASYTIELNKESVAKSNAALSGMNVAENNSDSVTDIAPKSLNVKSIMSENIECDTGFMTMTADVDESSEIGEMSLVFSNCTFDEVTTNGELEISVTDTMLKLMGSAYFSGIPDVTSLAYNNLNMVINFETLNSTTTFDVDIVSTDLTGTLGFSIIDNDTSAITTITGANNTKAIHEYNYDTYEEECSLNGDVIDCAELNLGGVILFK
ncbi:MAG: hypothetical protein HRU38_03555 [Saccharospirillaceae bacterium]|nr:hypothetical protein [Pseudomonadales bacterium]NRB77739.1 hypothetical protein [Saccharospirillaceae bacterium]